MLGQMKFMARAVKLFYFRTDICTNYTKCN